LELKEEGGVFGVTKPGRGARCGWRKEIAPGLNKIKGRIRLSAKHGIGLVLRRGR